MMKTRKFSSISTTIVLLLIVEVLFFVLPFDVVRGATAQTTANSSASTPEPSTPSLPSNSTPSPPEGPDTHILFADRENVFDSPFYNDSDSFVSARSTALFAAVLAGLAGNPIASAHIARSTTILSVCKPLRTGPLPLSQLPIIVPMGSDEDTQYYAGAALMNPVFLVGCCVVFFAISHVICSAKGYIRSRALSTGRFPSSLAFPLIFLVHPSTMCAVTVLSASGDQGVVIASGVMLAFWFSTIVLVAYFLLAKVPQYAIYVKDFQMKRRDHAFSQKRLKEMIDSFNAERLARERMRKDKEAQQRKDDEKEKANDVNEVNDDDPFSSGEGEDVEKKKEGATTSSFKTKLLDFANPKTWWSMEIFGKTEEEKAREMLEQELLAQEEAATANGEVEETQLFETDRRMRQVGHVAYAQILAVALDQLDFDDQGGALQQILRGDDQWQDVPPVEEEEEELKPKKAGGSTADAQTSGRATDAASSSKKSMSGVSGLSGHLSNDSEGMGEDGFEALVKKKEREENDANKTEDQKLEEEEIAEREATLKKELAKKGVHSGFVLMFGNFFNRYREHTRWFFVIEMVVSMCCGVLEGWRPPDAEAGSCRPQTILLMILFSIYFFLHVKFRPYISVFNRNFVLFISTMQFVGAIFTLVAEEESDRSAAIGAYVLAVLTVYCLVLKALMDAYAVLASWMETEEKSWASTLNVTEHYFTAPDYLTVASATATRSQKQEFQRRRHLSVKRGEAPLLVPQQLDDDGTTMHKEVEDSSSANKDSVASGTSLTMRYVNPLEDDRRKFSNIGGRQNAFVGSRGVPDSLHPFAQRPVPGIIPLPRRPVSRSRAHSIAAKKKKKEMWNKVKHLFKNSDAKQDSEIPDEQVMEEVEMMTKLNGGLDDESSSSSAESSDDREGSSDSDEMPQEYAVGRRMTGNARLDQTKKKKEKREEESTQLQNSSFGSSASSTSSSWAKLRASVVVSKGGHKKKKKDRPAWMQLLDTVRDTYLPEDRAIKRRDKLRRRIHAANVQRERLQSMDVDVSDDKFSSAQDEAELELLNERIAYYRNQRVDPSEAQRAFTFRENALSRAEREAREQQRRFEEGEDTLYDPDAGRQKQEGSSPLHKPAASNNSVTSFDMDNASLAASKFDKSSFFRPLMQLYAANNSSTGDGSVDGASFADNNSLAGGPFMGVNSPTGAQNGSLAWMGSSNSMASHFDLNSFFQRTGALTSPKSDKSKHTNEEENTDSSFSTSSSDDPDDPFNDADEETKRMLREARHAARREARRKRKEESVANTKNHVSPPAAQQQSARPVVVYRPEDGHDDVVGGVTKSHSRSLKSVATAAAALEALKKGKERARHMQVEQGLVQPSEQLESGHPFDAKAARRFQEENPGPAFQVQQFDGSPGTPGIAAARSSVTAGRHYNYSPPSSHPLSQPLSAAASRSPRMPSHLAPAASASPPRRTTVSDASPLHRSPHPPPKTVGSNTVGFGGMTTVDIKATPSPPRREARDVDALDVDEVEANFL